MFEVRTNSPIDEGWQRRDKLIEKAAGRVSDFAGTGLGSNECAGRNHGWIVATFDEAQAMKRRLSAVPDVAVTVREQ